MAFDIELVGKIGSMALINSEYNDIDYNILARLSSELKPGYVWVTSGATEIGRIDYIKRNGKELTGTDEEIKTDYAAQGQSILMSLYRTYVKSNYSIRQILVEHQHFNDKNKLQYLKKMLLRCPKENAIPIINYNDAVSYEENVKMEISALTKKNFKPVHCLDNDETASQIACLLKPETLLILTSVDGIYSDYKDKNTLVKEINGKDVYELIENISGFQSLCDGASRKGAGGAKAKLEYIKEPAKNGTRIIIANSKYPIKKILENSVPCTVVQVR